MATDTPSDWQQTSSELDREQLKIVVVGHVDHGKSTLIGRLFYDTDSLPEGRYEQIRDQCRRRGMPFEWSFLMDSFQAERDQGVTIDTTQIRFQTAGRDYMIIDAPGHKEFLKNMVSGAANSEAALLVIDAHQGVGEQSKRHGYLLHLLGVDQVAVAINKMDLEGYSQERFEAIREEYLAYLQGIGVVPTHVIPISAMEGDWVVGPSANMPWYEGPSVIEALEHFSPKPKLDDLPLRLPVQDVYKFDERRIIVGRIESGTLRVGDEILVSPMNKVARVVSFESWEGFQGDQSPQTMACANESVGITLDEQIFVERGDVISHQEAAPLLTTAFRANLFWLGDAPLEVGNRYKLKINTAEYPVEVTAIERVLDTDDLSLRTAEQVEKNGVAEIIMQARGLATLDEFSLNPLTGRFVLLDGYRIAGGGTVDLTGFADQRRHFVVRSTNLHPTEDRIDSRQRSLVNGHLGAVLWFTGLPSSGKTTLALELEQQLFARGHQVFVLDGDNIRSRLNADLGFDPQDRSENIRRVGEVAALFAEAGMIVIAAFISPYNEDRERARVAAGDRFHCVYIQADVATCEGRDPHGLWRMVRRGEISNFTGVDAPYEVPVNPELVINTRDYSIEQCVDQLLSYVRNHLVEPVPGLALR
ncbi:MAG: adenylyl-sulfate kinase [Dehalococcoidia bacterium]